VTRTEALLSGVKNLYIPMPSQKYFEEMLEKIDNKIETLPSKRIVAEEQRATISYFVDIFETLKTAVLQPYVAVSIAAMVAIVISAGNFFYSSESIQEKQINLSDVISKNAEIVNIDDSTGGINIYPSAFLNPISDPSEDEKLQINTTGTAKKDDKDQKLN